MTSFSTISAVATSALLALAIAMPLHAQSLRVNNAASATVPAAPDYAAEVKGDPWDFDKASDYIYTYSLGATQSSFEYTAWQPYPTVSNGVFSGVTREPKPSLQMLFGGIPGAMNAQQDTGLHTPIDASRYVTLSFRARRSWAAEAFELVKVGWEKGRRGTSPRGTLVLLAKGFDNDTGRWTNQNLLSAQGAANEWQVYRVRLTDDQLFPSNRFNPADTRWNDQVMGLNLALGDAPANSNVQVDWVRLTASRTVRLDWTGLGGSVVVTASDGTQALQVFPEDLPPSPPPATPRPRSTSGSFPDNSGITWDYGHLTPGTWTITARGTNATSTATVIVDASPFFEVLNPDETGGEDMATTLIGDPWDLTNREDVFRFSSPVNALFDVKGPTFTPQGLKAVAFRSSGAQSDSQVRFFDDDLGAKFSLTPAQARRYHRLTFSIDYDVPVQPTFDPLAPNPFLEDVSASGRPGVGGVMRIIWRTAANRGGAFAVSCDLPVQDGGPRTYTLDLSALTTAAPDCSGELMASLPSGSAWGSLASNVTNFRLDINEGALDTPFTLSNLKLGADDEPDAAGRFVVQWAALDGRYSGNPVAPSNASVAIYVDTDLDPSTKQLVARDIPASTGAYVWDLARTPGGITPGTYQVYIEMTDAAGYSFGKYASGPLQVTRTYEVPMTLTEWQTFYGLTNLAADSDGDGLNNQAEFDAGTSPLIANRSELAEGSTGFFQERVAIANPENRAAVARVTVLFGQRSDIGEPTPPAPITQEVSIAAYGRHTLNVNGLAGSSYSGQGRPVSVIVESVRGGVVVERTMSFGDGWGGHTGKALLAPARQWFLAEGAANGFFQTFILLTATGTAVPKVTVDFLLEDGQVVSMPTEFASAPGRLTLWANELCAPGTSGASCNRVLAGKSFSTRITSDQPITVERAMYFNRGGRTFEGGHASAAVTAPATRWFVAEGTTGPLFDTYLLLANPGSADTVATVRYLTPEGPYTATYAVKANSRRTLFVDSELSVVSGRDAINAQIDVSAEVSAPQPIVVERAMYWFGPFQNWTDGHNSAGVTTTGTDWALAEGQEGGALKYKTFVLIANPSGTAASVRVRLLREGGRPVVTSAPFPVAASSRFTCYAGQPGPCADAFAQLQDGEMFGIQVESVSGTPIVIERAMYWDYAGETFSAGTNETGIRIR